MKPFRILLITQEDPFYVKLFFEKFFKIYSPLENIMGVVIAPTMGKKSFRKLIKKMFEFYGPLDFIRMGFKYLWYKVGNRVSRIISLKQFYSIHQICRYYNIPVKVCDNINSESFLKDIGTLGLDLIISVAAPQIFKKKLINIPRKGCINIHNSKLPKYRGMLPNFWQMFNGEKSVGTTIHQINAGIDDGDILMQFETPIIEGESLDSLIRKAKIQGASLMVEAINKIKINSLNPVKNPSVDATYFTFPTRQEVIEFKRKGYRLL